MREVAAAASVSVGTVSNVLNTPDKVAPATVQRVLAAIDRLGFVRNDAARQLKAGRSRCVGLVVLDISNPFFSDVAGGPPPPRPAHHPGGGEGGRGPPPPPPGPAHQRTQ
uniref:LacI family DNA-binding transcriptional regulator n=1 Tax=Nocardia abscessus TaxID=120957 RepID=UPI0024544C00